MKSVRVCVWAAVAFLAAAVPPISGAEPQSPVHLLDVPYLPQSEALCGGAAAAMVMRFWGAADVYADTFESLVDPSAGGIHGNDLVRALEQRGWQARTFKGDMPLLREQIQKGRPLIALIEDRPGRFHYVVVVGAYGDRLVVHDPARAPFRVTDETAFARAWERSGFWTLIVLPGAAAKPSVATTEPYGEGGVRASAPSRCEAIVDEGVRLARDGHLEDARGVLDLAADTCPESPAPWRERAGLHALREEWAAAASDAREALRRDPNDEHAERTLATSLFLEGNLRGALDAWNGVGEPVVDLVNVHGLERTRYEVAARALGVQPRTLLTSSALLLAERRLSDLPASLVSRVTYRPAETGLAQLDAVVVERPVVPSGIVPIAAIGVRVVTDRELAVPIASPTGGGELWTVAWRWWEHRPRVGLSFSAPTTNGVRGVWSIDAFTEKQTYATPAGIAGERRRGAAVQLGSWATGALRVSAAAGIDRWIGRGTSVSLGGATEYRAYGDKSSASARVAVLRGDVRTWTFGAGAAWRSRTRNERAVILTRAGVDVAGAAAPMALWPGAGTGQGRDVLLRAHPLLHDGVIARGVLGRTLVHGGAEWRYWLRPGRRPLRVAPAIFIDAAGASRTAPPFETRAQVDTGAGVRIALAGSGVLRIDVGRGMRDGGTVWSIGWTR